MRGKLCESRNLVETGLKPVSTCRTITTKSLPCEGDNEKLLFLPPLHPLLRKEGMKGWLIWLRLCCITVIQYQLFMTFTIGYGVLAANLLTQGFDNCLPKFLCNGGAAGSNDISVPFYISAGIFCTGRLYIAYR